MRSIEVALIAAAEILFIIHIVTLTPVSRAPAHSTDATGVTLHSSPPAHTQRTGQNGHGIAFTSCSSSIKFCCAGLASDPADAAVLLKVPQDQIL